LLVQIKVTVQNVFFPFTTLDVTQHVQKLCQDPLTLISGGNIWIP
jgi:hypothetical protein